MRGTFLLFFCLLSVNGIPIQKNVHLPEEDMTTPEIISYYGYPSETHFATTSDGYILQMHRIPFGINSPKKWNDSRPVILMQHGLEAASDCWVINLPYQSAGYVFADAGYDVWLGNFRGNTYGKEHTKLTTDDRQFWRFSWDEMAQYDLEAMFNTIEEVTGQREIYYLGHSQGTLTMFAKFSTDPEFRQRVKRFFALAPVATVKTIKGMLLYLADYVYPYVGWIFNLLGDGEFLPSNWLMKLISKYVCDGEFEAICANIIFLVAGPETSNLNQTRMGVITSHAPAGTSTENFLHWTQMVISGQMQMYDFRDDKENKKHYGRSKPPMYDLTQIEDVKIHLYSSTADTLADPTDINNYLIPNLNPNVVQEHVILDDYSHLDFVWGIRSTDDLYDPILRTIKKLDNVP
ncbi:Lipase [Aphelenchoides besseyi]|nr:Lipase [Aphelenchoides besseyi]